MNVLFIDHARQNMEERGVSDEEVIEVLATGTTSQGRYGRQITTKVLTEGYERRGISYAQKEVQLVHVYESSAIIIITVKTRYGRFEEVL